MNKTKLHVVPSEPRTVKLCARTRHPLLPVEQSGPRTQADIDTVPEGHEPMYRNQQLGQAIEGKRRTGWSRFVLKLKGKR